MIFFNKFYILFCVIIAFILVPNLDAKKKNKYLLNKPQCTDKNLKKVELNIAKIISLGRYGRPFPENFDQLKPYCR